MFAKALTKYLSSNKDSNKNNHVIVPAKDEISHSVFTKFSLLSIFAKENKYSYEVIGEGTVIEGDSKGNIFEVLTSHKRIDGKISERMPIVYNAQEFRMKAGFSIIRRISS